MMDVHNVTYHRWRNAGKITGAYKKIIEDFLAKNDHSATISINTSSTSSSINKTSDIAVIGIACYYPGASNTKELWENILARRVQFRRMLDQRLPLGEYHDEDPKSTDKTYLTKAAFLENFNFDWGKLRIPKKTVESTDIAHWLALDIALKTFEDAGYKLNDIPLQNTGVIVGNTLTGEQTRSQTLRLRWPFVQKALNATLGHLGKSAEERGQIASEMEKIFKSAFYPVTEDSLAGGLANTIAGRICNYLNLKGGGYIVDGACSSSLLAVATAADALKMGNMDLALAGGVDISLDPFELVGFSRAGALAKDQMRVYDQKANGFLPGEGCGFVLLKRLADAERDKNYVYAVIKGWGISSDGKGGIMEPSSSGQSFAIGRAYKDLEYKISDVDFVEGHGTGTTKGDRVELEGIAAAIDKTIKKENENKRSCGVTSFKSIVGHTKAAAGVGGLIKAVLAVNQRIMPPTANCSQPNDVFKDKARHLFPIIQGIKLDQDRKARAGISSAGFGGINCHVTVESLDKPRQEIKPDIDESALFVSHQETEVFVFTSRTVIHLKKIIEKFKTDLRNISLAEMADLAALINKKVKNRLPIKAAIVTDTPEHLYEALILLENEITSSSVTEGEVIRIKAKDTATHIILSNGVKKARIGFLYPGQGSQRLNMTRTLVERYPWAKDLFSLSKLSLLEKMYVAFDKVQTKEEQQEFEKQLSDTRITQPAIVLSSLIWSEFFAKLGIEPQFTLGHSLGELTAFYRAGAFDKEALVKFSQLRGELMAADSKSSGSMVSLFCSKEKAEALIEKVSGNMVIANINHPNQIVVSGGKKEIEKIKELAAKENISTYQLNVSNAFHSSFMKDASEKIGKTKILPDTFKTNGIAVYSCVSGEALSGKFDLKDYFSNQMVSPVNFVAGIESAAQACDLMIELGPGKVLTDLIKLINGDILSLPVESVANSDRDLNIALAEIFVRNVPIKFEELYKNRLIKTFVPASRKKFIENQCEHPLKIGNQILGEFSLPSQDSIPQPDEIIPGGLPEFAGKDKVADLLVSLTQEITGFDRESISLNLRLLDDLNLDSIKAAELIGKAARTLGIPGQVDPSQLSNNNLAQIRDRLNELAAAAVIGTVKESVTDILKRYQDKPWVRNFVVDLKPEEVKTRNVNQLKELKNFVFISNEHEEGIVEKVTMSLRAHKAKQSPNIQQIYFGDSSPKSEKQTPINCLIAILPRILGENLNKASLKSTIEQLHQITDLANSSRLDKNSFVVFVQFGGGATAVASTLFLERPDLKVRIIDFDESIGEDKISQGIIDELQTYESFSSVKYDKKMSRHVVCYENSLPYEYKKRDISWSNKDVVLVTGGAKGITAQCALEFARSTKARMVLVGRSPEPENKKDDSEINQTIKQFESEHLKASYYQCDVTNEKDVFKTIDEIEKKHGPITGFVHGAGLNSLKRLKQASVQEALHEALPKVMGAVNVCNALKDHPPKLIVGITSIIGLTGMEGSGWYGLANEVLNLYLQSIFPPPIVGRVRARGANRPYTTEVVTIAYSVWDEVGMGAKLGSVDRLAEKGIGAIPVKEGIKHFRQLIETDPGAQQVIVAARVAGINTWKSPDLKPNNLRFLEKFEYILPGVELIARANLNIEDDPYLLDHNWKGSLLFPFVFGFEAMVQAAAYVLGVEKIENIKAKDINLQRPISVPQDSGTTIEIHAQVLEREESKGHDKEAGHSRKSGNPVQVKVDIYSQESAYTEPHFSAIIEIDSMFVIPAKAGIHNKIDSKTVKNIIDLDVQTDIYGPILFQGKMFQCIEQIHELYYDEATKKGECLFTSEYNKTAQDFLNKNKKFNKKFLTGDPFFIDSMLQSMQLIIPQDISLPRDINEIELNHPAKSNSKYSVHSNIKRIDVDYYRGDAEVNNNSGFELKVKNCRLKVLDTILSNPSANDLVNPAKRDQKIIENKLAELSKELNFVPPVVKCAYDERLKNAPKELRHKIELPLIKSAVDELLKREGKSVKDIKIKWLKSGRPVVENKEFEDIGVSLAHDGSFLIVVVGHGEQGCDVENIKHKSLHEWQDVLGKDKYKIFEAKMLNNTDETGSVIWCMFEAAKKLTQNNNIEFLKIEKREDCIASIIDYENQKFKVFAFILNQTKSDKKAFSLSVKFLDKSTLKAQENYNDASILERFGYKDNIFNINLDYKGPQDQLVYTQRFPVTFKNNQQLSRRVYFTSYFDWIGLMREYSLYPIMGDITKLTESGGWGLATNQVITRIWNDLRANDVVEIRCWVERILGNTGATFDTAFEWSKVLENGDTEKVAYAELRSTWIQITGHGEAKIGDLPSFLIDFVSEMKPKSVDKVSSLENIESKSIKFDLGEINSSLKSKILLGEQNFQTSLEDSNLVGNIYFANYAKWLGRTRDLYFYNLMPNLYRGVGNDGEFFTLNCDIFHLQEAMPFDNVLVKMYINKAYEFGLELYFEYFLNNRNSSKKLAFGYQKVGWVKRNDNVLELKRLPDEIIKNLKSLN